MTERTVTEETLSGGVAGTLLRCAGATTGVVVLSGSSGRVDVARARLFAEEGASALALQWFGGEGQVPGICEIPIETFFAATDRLIQLGCRRIVYVGTSKGAEASLLAAAHDPRIDAVVAISPTSVVWGNIGPGRDGVSWPERSSWTLEGIPLPFVPSNPDWSAEHVDGLVSYRGTFRALPCRPSRRRRPRPPSLSRPSRRKLYWLPVAVMRCSHPLDFAHSIVRRRKDAGKTTHLVSTPDAGHRILLPGENTPRSKSHAHGGNDDADAQLGQ